MSSRIVWFVAGSVAGVYTAAKARRAAYRLSAPGLVDQASALGVGWRELGTEVRDGMLAREQEIARRLATDPATAPLGLDEATHDSYRPDNTPPDLRDT